MSTTDVSLDGLPLISDASLGGRWRVLSLDGWFSRTYRRNRQAKAQQDGAWQSAGYAGDVPITIRGLARFSDAFTAKSAARQFVATAGRGILPLFVQDGLGGLTRYVECDSVNASPVNELMFEWSLVLDATDPLAYGAPTFAQTTLASTAAGVGRVWPRVWPRDWGVPPGVTPGAVTLANAGTAPYWPRLRVDGPSVNSLVTLVETGDWVRYGGELAAGQWLDIDCANRRVLLNGRVSVRQQVTSSGSWLAVPVGGGSVSWTDDGGNENASLSVWGYEGAWV